MAIQSTEVAYAAEGEPPRVDQVPILTAEQDIAATDAANFLSALSFLLVRGGHWDRAWYQDRFKTMIREAEACREITDVIQNGQIAQYNVEQTSILRDYLNNFCKGEKDKIKLLCSDKSLELTPLEIQQDGFLGSEETLFNNIHTALRFIKEIGGTPSTAMYLPDTFGFHENTPKVLRAAGFDNLIYTRGNGNEIRGIGAVYNWQSDDGSQIFAIPMQGGYGNANRLGRFREDKNGHVSLPDNPEQWAAAATDTIKEFIKKYGPRYEKIALSTILLGNGCDFERPDLYVEGILGQAMEQLESDFPGISFKFGTFDDYVKVVRNQLNLDSLQTFQGELRSSCEHNVTPGVTSTRMPLKQEADRADREIFAADAITAMLILSRNVGRLAVQGHDSTLMSRVLLEAKRTILSPMSHDAITGCGADEDYLPMFRDIHKARSLAEQVRRNSLAAAAVAPAGMGTKDREEFNVGREKYSHTPRYGDEVSIVNPLPEERQGLVEIPVPTSLKQAAYIAAESNGESIPVQLVEREGGRRFAIVSVNVDGYGSLPISLSAADKPAPQEQDRWANEISNEFYSVHALPNGTVAIKDKLTGFETTGLVFEDCGDRGDEYNFDAVQGDIPITTLHNTVPAEVEVIASGPVFTELQINTTMRVPSAVTADRSARASETVELPIQTNVRLIHGVDRIEFTTTYDNTAKDHRLRVHFDTPDAPQTVRAKEPYGMTVRDAVPVKGSPDWSAERLPIAPSHNQGLVVAGSVALSGKGLPEYEAVEGPDGNIREVALTLVRAVGYLSRDDLTSRLGNAGPSELTPDAQCLGQQVAKYSLNLRGQSDNAAVIKNSLDYHQNLILGPRNINWNGVLELRSKEAVVSTLKPTDDGKNAMIRLYNPTDKPAPLAIGGLVRAIRCHALWGTPLEGEEETSETTIPPHKIATFLLRPAGA